ncbi:MAG: beta-galactosidase, partial [Myxococcota bacterium]
DHMESFFPGLRVEPTKNVSARVDLSVLGNVNSATINEVFYESRGEPVSIFDTDGEELTWTDRERVKVYAAEFHVEDKGFELDGYYRVGHYHWGYEGDFFGMYREAYYGPNLDLYNGDAPLGVEWTGKKKLDGLKIAAGPQIYWGANPTIIAKYYKDRGALEYAFMHQEDVGAPPQIGGQRVIQEQLTRKTSLYLGYELGAAKVEIGGLWAGTEKIGMNYMSAEAVGGPSYLNSGYRFTEDEIYWFDTLGAKGKVTFTAGPVNAYLKGSYKGRVADAGGGDQTLTFTGWSLQDDFRGNQWNIMGGTAIGVGQLQIAPNAIYQKPLDGPLPVIDGAVSPNSGIWYPTVLPRNKLISPFAVLGNREMLGLELLLAFDPTPGTFMWQYDNDWREDAAFAASIDLVYRHFPTSRDADFGWTAEGVLFAFPGAPAAADLWDVNGRFVMNPGGGLRWIIKPYAGAGQADGDDQRIITRYGTTSSWWWKRSTLATGVKVGDWGPFDFHRDFNLTYPLQLTGDLSRGFGRSVENAFSTKFGVMTNVRWLDRYSPRFLISDNGTWGNEWEIATYLEVGL